MIRKGSRTSLSIVQKFFPNVLTVKDAKDNVMVEVTSKDVSTSNRRKHAGCAMAVACKRALFLDGVLIARSRAFLVKGAVATRFDVPGSVSREVVSFDRGSNFEPGLYQLSKPYHRLGEHKGGKSKQGTGTGRPIPFRHLTENVRAVLGSE